MSSSTQTEQLARATAHLHGGHLDGEVRAVAPDRRLLGAPDRGAGLPLDFPEPWRIALRRGEMIKVGQAQAEDLPAPRAEHLLGGPGLKLDHLPVAIDGQGGRQA